MKLYTIRNSQGNVKVVASTGTSGWADITDLYPTMIALIVSGARGMTEVTRRLHQKDKIFEWDDSWMIVAPIPEPVRNVYCVGWNYLKHFNEGVGKRGNQEADLPEFPTFFTKSTRSVIGPRVEVPYDSEFTTKLDYEGEVAVIIGREGKNIGADEALSYVFGYSLANDVSARDVQRRHGGQWLKGKSMDGSCPLGPAIVTADEIPVLEDLTIRCVINGEVRQEARLNQLIFSIPRIIEELSRGMTLVPGDIVLTGTPDGVGFAMNPPVFLNPGDHMTVESEQLGRLENVVGPDYHEMR